MLTIHHYDTKIRYHRKDFLCHEGCFIIAHPLRYCRTSLEENRHLEIIPVILSAAKDLASLPKRSFAALRMTGRTPLKPAHGRSYLQMSTAAGFGFTNLHVGAQLASALVSRPALMRFLMGMQYEKPHDIETNK